MKMFAKKRWWMACFSVVVGAVLFFWIQGQYVTPIITYHNIGDHQVGKLNTVSEVSFERHLEFIKRHHLNVISFEDYVAKVQQGIMPRHSVVIHFDDGFEDNYTKAFPILKKYGFPAMVFVITDVLGVDPRFITWNQAKEMDKAGFSIGSHTRRHPYLPSLSPEQAWDEIVGSKKIIERHLGKPADYFVYPSGGFTDEVKEIVKRAGYKAAGTTNRGRDRLNRDLFELNRIRLKNSDSDIVLWAKLSGFYNIFREERDPY